MRAYHSLDDADPFLPASAALAAATRKALNAPGHHPVETFYESLDMLRFPRAQIEDEIVALLASKFEASIDAVVTIGPAALDFAEKHRGRLWPDARIFFQIVPDEVLRQAQLSPTTTGIPVKYNFAGTVEIALALRPATRRLIVVYGSGDYDRRVGAIAREQLQPFASRLPVEYWTDATIAATMIFIPKLLNTA